MNSSGLSQHGFVYVNIDATDKAMLTNDSVLGVDQDAVAAKRIVNSGNDEVFSKKERCGSVTV
jgi:hypothetical protein